VAWCLRAARALTPGGRRPGRQLRQVLIAFWLASAAVAVLLGLGCALLHAGLPGPVLVPLLVLLGSVVLTAYGVLFVLLPVLVFTFLRRYAGVGGRRPRG
jgi:hypothetical protein